MNRSGILTASLAFTVFALVSSAGRTQTSSPSSDATSAATPVPSTVPAEFYKTVLVPAAGTLSPFSVDASPPASAKLIEFRSVEQMSAQDRELATRTQAAIRERAELAGMDFDKGTWTDQQLVCQALPGHVFLLFKGGNGAGDLSLFSAAVPRADQGRVRVIAIERRGFSLFSPASVNPLTITAFNRIRADEPAPPPADWLATALCYAALAGAHPLTSPLPEKAGDANPSLTFPPTLEVGASGESTVRFVDVAAVQRPMQWALTFDAKGQLVKVAKFATAVYAVQPINPKPAPQASTQSH
jgi:hypothetical protein